MPLKAVLLYPCEMTSLKPGRLRTILNGKWDMQNDLDACGMSSFGKLIPMRPVQKAPSTMPTQDDPEDALKQMIHTM